MLTFPVTLFSGAQATRTFIGSNSDGSGLTTYSFGSVALGTAEGTSLVAVVVHGFTNGIAGTVLSSGSVNGVGATIQVQATGNLATSSTAVVAILTAATSGTSGTVSVTFNNGMVGAAIARYRLNNLTSATADHTAAAHADSGTSTSTSIAVSAGGLLLEGASAYASSLTTTGATQDVRATVSVFGQYFDGSNDGLAAQTASLSASFSGAPAALVSATWH